MRRVVLLAVVSLAALSGEARGQGADEGTLCVLNTRLSPENAIRTAADTNNPTVESTATGHAPGEGAERRHA